MPAFFTTRAALQRYALAMALMCAAGLAIFYLWPTVIPAPDIDWHRYPQFAFLKTVDATGNACPSLHVATALLSAVWFDRVLRGFGAPRWLVAGTWAWCAAIVCSTVAVRQHVALDVVGGLVLGGLAAWLSVRFEAANIGASTAR
jgi:membrane-associated phospholipid phosphatase